MENVKDKVISALQDFVAKYPNKNVSAAARDLGLKNMTLKNWIEETRTPNLEALQPVFEALKWQIVFPGEHVATYEFIPCGKPRLDEGILKIEEFPHAPIAMESFWMQNKGIFAQNAVMIEVADDSMAPLYAPLDLVLVDRADVEPKNGGIYLLSDDRGEIMLRRLKSEVGTGWTLLPENRSWQWAQKTIPDLSHIKIHGRVRWSCRSFG